MSKYNKVFIICPGGLKTGGTELLHQLSYQLNELQLESHIVYIGSRLETPIEFKKYITTKVYKECEIEDEVGNLLIVPESYVEYVGLVQKMKKSIWWLSVDNYTKDCSFKSRKEIYGQLSAIYHAVTGRIKDKTKWVLMADFNLCQSYYSIQYLKTAFCLDDKKIIYLSDYINDCYTEEYNGVEVNNRKNVVLYNPLKGYKFTKKIMKLARDISWVPIKNMRNDEVRKLLKSSKVYIDFGHHPGKDRFPREAAISGCCVITGKRGAAAYEEDLPIPKEFKFDEKQSDKKIIIQTIRKCFIDYETIINEYEPYRQMILSEKTKFRKDINNIFG